MCRGSDQSHDESQGYPGSRLTVAQEFLVANVEIYESIKFSRVEEYDQTENARDFIGMLQATCVACWASLSQKWT